MDKTIELLEKLHATCMNMETELSDAKLHTEELDDIEASVQALTFEIQSKIDELNGEHEDETECDCDRPHCALCNSHTIMGNCPSCDRPM